jgi:UDPglucose--hexose-1-phosphate uridylyltransferase
VSEHTGRPESTVTERRYDPVAGEWRSFGGVQTLPPAGEPCELCGPAFDIAVLAERYNAAPAASNGGLYARMRAAGAEEVVVYSDDHHLSLGDMEVHRIARVVEVWADRYATLGSRDEVAYVFIFENRTASGEHPHGRISAYPQIPPRAQRELDVASDHIDEHGTCVYCDVVARERFDGVRVVAHNRSFLAFVPFAARFPYEVHVASLRHAASLLDLGDPERLALAEVLRSVVRAYDGLTGDRLPYVMALHQAPTDDGEHQHISHFHVEFTPVSRLAGSELGAGAYQNDTTPEDSAARLRAASSEGAP